MRAPEFWLKQDMPSRLAASALSPLGWTYGAVTNWKRRHASPYRARAKVVCVGNLTAGGTGSETFAASSPSNPIPNSTNRFFANVNVASGIDNAATIEVDPSLVGNPSLLDGTANAPSPSIALALSNSFAQSTPVFAPAGNFPAPLTLTLGQYTGQILGQTSTAAANASDNNQFQTSVLQSVTTQASAVSGVNMDEELSHLTIFQNAYAASATVIQTVNSMFNSLLQTVQ
jgi:flagellar hook-associated protein FlgK